MGELGDVLAMLGGAAIQQRAMSQAADRQRAMALAAQQRQLQLRDDANSAVLARAAQYAPAARQVQQQQIQSDLTGQYDQQLQKPQITAQGVQVGSTLPEGQGGTDYLAAKAKQSAQTAQSMHALAQLMARIGSADQLRTNEAVGLGDTAGQVSRIQDHAQQQAGIDDYAIRNAGQVGVGPMIAGAALRGIGTSGMSKWGLAPASPAVQAPAVVSGPLGSGLWSLANLRKVPLAAGQGGALGSGTWLDPNAPY